MSALSRAHICDPPQEDDWADEDRQNQGFSHEEFQMLSEMLGPKGVAFDNDEFLDDNDDEDLKMDPISQIDMTVRRAHNTTFTRIDTSCSRATSSRSSRSVPPETQITSPASLTGSPSKRA